MIKGVTPTYPIFLETILMLPFCGYNCAINPNRVLLPDPFAPVKTVCLPLETPVLNSQNIFFRIKIFKINIFN